MIIYGVILTIWNGENYSVTEDDVYLFATKEARDIFCDNEPKSWDVVTTKFEKELEEEIQ